MRSVNDESRAIEMTYDIEGTQLYANSTTLDTDGGVYKWLSRISSLGQRLLFGGATRGLHDWSVSCGILIVGR